VVPTVDETLELVERLRRSDVNPSTLDSLGLTVERLCSAYSSEPSEPLRLESLGWLAHLNNVLDSRLTLQQHREVLVLACWLTLLVGCLEYDMKMTSHAETTRRIALHLVRESGHTGSPARSGCGRPRFFHVSRVTRLHSNALRRVTRSASLTSGG